MSIFSLTMSAKNSNFVQKKLRYLCVEIIRCDSIGALVVEIDRLFVTLILPYFIPYAGICLCNLVSL